jgi:flagellar hook-associated protein 3 FlgL
MRVTGNRLIDISAAATSRNQSRVADLTDEMSSGLRVSTPSDDPSAWLAARRAELQRTLNEGTTQAMQLSRDRLDQTDGALSTISQVVSQVRELAIEGSNDSIDATGRAGLSQQVQALFQSAVAAANAQSPDGEYLLAGAQSLTAPFDTATGAYTGDSATRAVPTDDTATQIVRIAGSDLTAANGVDVLPLLSKVASALTANDTTTLRGALTDLETAVKQMAATRTSAGNAMTVLDTAKTAHAQLEQTLTSEISNDVEADTVSTASDLAKASQALQVSQAVSAHIISLLAPPTTSP